MRRLKPVLAVGGFAVGVAALVFVGTVVAGSRASASEPITCGSYKDHYSSDGGARYRFHVCSNSSLATVSGTLSDIKADGRAARLCADAFSLDRPKPICPEFVAKVGGVGNSTSASYTFYAPLFGGIKVCNGLDADGVPNHCGAWDYNI